MLVCLVGIGYRILWLWASLSQPGPCHHHANATSISRRKAPTGIWAYITDRKSSYLSFLIELVGRDSLESLFRPSSVLGSDLTVVLASALELLGEISWQVFSAVRGVSSVIVQLQTSQLLLIASGNNRSSYLLLDFLGRTRRPFSGHRGCFC